MNAMSLIRQGGSYVLVGLLQLLLDWAVFVATTALGLPAAPANLLARVSGALLGFWLNGRVTFARDGAARLGWGRFVRFALVWLALTAVSQFGIQPWLAQLKAEALPREVMESVLRDRFATWHGISSILYLVQSLLGVLLVAGAGRGVK